MKYHVALFLVSTFVMVGCDSKPAEPKAEITVSVRVDETSKPLDVFIDGSGLSSAHAIYRELSPAAYVQVERLRQITVLLVRIRAAESELKELEKLFPFSVLTEKDVREKTEAAKQLLRQEIDQKRTLVLSTLTEIEKAGK
jgi:hypothetical protein